MFRKLLQNVTGVPTKMVLVVRTDLKMNKGKIASQCAHAAVTLYDVAFESNKNVLKQWVRLGQPKIVLQVNSEKELRRMYENARNLGLNACLIHDAGKTQINPGTLTVLGIGPNYVGDIDKITNNLKLL